MSQHVNTKTTYGEAGALDKLVAHELTEFNDDTITLIGPFAFYYQKEGLNEIYLPAVKQIEEYAFNNASSVSRIYIGLNNQSVTTLNSIYAIGTGGRCIFIVPDNLVNAYKAATNWTSVGNRIYGINDEANWPVWNETEISDDVATIKSHVLAGTAASRYDMGQYKEMDLGTEGVIRMQIVGKNMRELANSTDKAQLEWLAMGTMTSDVRFNPPLSGSSGNYVEGTGTIGGYDKSELKTYIDTNIWALVPSDWKDMIKETKIISRSYDTTGAVQRNEETTAKLRIPSYYELYATGLTYGESSGPVYAYATGIFAEHRIRRWTNGTSLDTYWTRTAYSTSVAHIISNNGSSSSNYGVDRSRDIILSFST